MKPRSLICNLKIRPEKTGEGPAKLLEIASVLSVHVEYAIVWKKDNIDPQELASKRWVERWTVDRIASHFGWGRTAVVRKLGELKANPELIEDGVARSHVKSRKYRFMGS